MQHCASGDVEVLHDLVVRPVVRAWTVSRDGREGSKEGRDAHLPSGVDQSLLRWGDTRLLLDLLLDAGDLPNVQSRGNSMSRVSMQCKEGQSRQVARTWSSGSISSSICRPETRQKVAQL